MEFNLLGLPENLLYTVFEYSGFRSILTLRKVCHDFRNFIDDKIPDIGLKSMVIMINPQNVTIYYDAQQQSNRLLYLKHKEGCLVKHNDMEYLLEDEEFVDVFLKELGQILEHQKSTLESFRMVCGNVNNEEEYQHLFFPLVEKIQDMLKSRENLLKIKCINLDAFKPVHVLAILPFINPTSLEEIIISHPNFGILTKSEKIFEIKELSELDQWKSAKVLNIFQLKLSPDIKDFIHFTKVSVRLHRVSKEVLEFLKEKMFCDSTMMTVFEMRCGSFDDEPEYLRSMEQYKTDESERGVRTWTIQIPKHKKRLEVSYAPEQRRMVFSKS